MLGAGQHGSITTRAIVRLGLPNAIVVPSFSCSFVRVDGLLRRRIYARMIVACASRGTPRRASGTSPSAASTSRSPRSSSMPPRWIDQLYTAAPEHRVVVCLDEIGPERAKSFAGHERVRATPREGHPAERARQESDDGRRGTGYVFGAWPRATPARDRRGADAVLHPAHDGQLGRRPRAHRGVGARHGPARVRNPRQPERARSA